MTADPPAHPDDPDEWRHERVRVNGVDLHCVVVDPDRAAVDNPTGAPPLVVLLHGFPEHWYAWHRQLDAVAAAGYRVVAPDLRGYNRSDQPAGVAPYRPAELVADVRGLIAHYGGPTATVVGHDWGGLVGWELAIRDPEVVRRLAVLNAPHPDSYRRRLRRSPEQLLRSWYVFAAQLPWVPERLLWAGRDRLVDAIAADAVDPAAVTEATRTRYREAIERAGSLAGPINYYRAMGRETLELAGKSLLPGRSPRDGTVTVPTLVCWGVDDPMLGPALLADLDEWVPECRIRRFSETSHWPQLERPQRVTEELLDVL
ncbi:alpha/beta fold hydrolase [Halovenus sp. WSH3]|uniref:Alpha/beta fold hydrolase n=1 Tax=Halovenus carboxidivorans TaxID=2692199 RepID=A0A6B0T3T6_9EURY|nr:alpha/beta hydrolase [Halovenus carboxidivorans]MXR50133.1 alpha/beta fold hydrolase [Halovenus carboxidivorans]